MKKRNQPTTVTASKTKKEQKQNPPIPAPEREREWQCEHFYLSILLTTALKLLLIPTYTSTDFEVHRNWMAITSQNKTSEWYFEETSIWTLDYPPLFAWFEKLLSIGAYYADPKMLEVNALNYKSEATLVYMRLTVIVSDLLLHYGIYRLTNSLSVKPKWLLYWISVCNFGLILVDHIHFQYNGFLFGIMLLSIACIFEKNYVGATILFSILLHFKHIFLYLAPAYFVYLFRNYCFSSGSLNWRQFRIGKFLLLGVCVIAVSLISFGPFILWRQLPQLFRRLFPFNNRGLCHAYWAPNFWAFYSFLDRVSLLAVKYWNPEMISPTQLSLGLASTRGLVENSSFFLLPNITPVVTLVLTLVAMMPPLIKSSFRPDQNFLDILILCGFSTFLFGWHVHEKAILIIILPFGFLSFYSVFYAKQFVLLSLAGHYSLFPLLFTSAEHPIKVLLFITYSLLVYSCLKYHYRDELKWNFVESVYMGGFAVLHILVTMLPYYSPLSKYEFLPLMITSVYCTMGIMYVWLSCWISCLVRSAQTLVNKIEIKKNNN